MPQFMLVMHRDPAILAGFSPEKAQQALQKYVAWTKRPTTIDAQRLTADTGRVIRGNKVSDGPYSETKEVMGGFYLIDANDYDQAVQLALDHPHLEYGGTIEVRALHQM